MVKTKLLDPENAVRTLKVFVTGILTSLALAIPSALGWFIRSKGYLAVGLLVGLFTFIGSIWFFGWLIKRLWGWK